jgi:hypothetical protein
MAADITLRAATASVARRRLPTFGLSWRILGLVIVAIMTAELLLFLPSIARYRLVYLEQLIESGTLAALALDATPDNMVTDDVKRALLNHARVDAVVLVEPNKPRRALLNIPPRPDMPSFNLKERGALGLIWDALATMSRDGAYYTRVGGESRRLPKAMVWIVVDELPMRIAMYDYTVRVLVLSIIIALFTAALLYLALRWLVIRPLQDLSADMVAFRRDPEEAGSDRPPSNRNDEWSTASSRTCSTNCAPRCARSHAWPRSARPRTRSTTTFATSCRPRACCRIDWRIATTSARASSPRPS